MIELKHVIKEYGNTRKPVFALKNISMKINDGEFICITGESGSGKSTLLNIISGMVLPTEGEVIYDGSFSSRDRKQTGKYRGDNIGIILQDHTLLNDRDVFSNVELPLLIKKEKKSVRKRIVTDWIARVGMEDKMHSYPDELSGGQQQRVAIARAVAGGAEIILADEPTGSLDEDNALMIAGYLKDLSDNGKTVIMVTHDLELTDMCDRHIRMRDGEIVSDT